MRAKISAVFAALPNLTVAAFAVVYMVANSVLAPESLTADIGGFATGWTWLVLLSLIVAGALALLQDRIGAMQGETAARILAGGVLFAYAVALFGSGTFMTGGLAVGFAIKQLGRAWYLQAERIPERRLINNLKE